MPLHQANTCDAARLSVPALCETVMIYAFQQSIQIKYNQIKN